MIEVLGIAADGELAPGGAELLASADVVLGGRRQLDLVADRTAAEAVEWPRPLRDGLAELVQTFVGRQVVALASGDPLLSGIGGTLIDLLGAESVRIHPSVSSIALARARMCWTAEQTTVLRLGDPALLRRMAAPGRRLLLLSADQSSPAAVAAELVAVGLGRSRVTVLGDLGTEAETVRTAAAADWSGDSPRLNVIAVECAGARSATGVLTAGLPDTAYQHDGQLTRRHVRAAALAMLEPLPGELLWDLGAGSGSIGIEWARAHPDNRVLAVERDPVRVERVRGNARALGVPGISVLEGKSAQLLDRLEDPDAVFIGGGAELGLIDRCWQRLRPGGRLVVHAVTLEGESLLNECRSRFGGELFQIHVTEAGPLGSLTGWRPTRPIRQLVLHKS